jgi:CheY-like chemotaxis protein
MDLVRLLSASRGIRLTAALEPPPLCLHADRRRVKQVLVNLLSNAVKYNRPHGSITVSARRADGRVRLSVTDTGAGIPADQLSRLFHPFERLSADRSSIEGTGLGLAVSKGLVQAMGGQIGVESSVGVGSTFWIDLAEAAVAEPAPVDRPAVRAEVAGGNAAGTILYVEDNGSNVRLMERLLGRRDGIRLLTADSGAAALDLLARDRPDLILLDLHLPDMPGEDVLHALQADAGTRDIPIVILTADATSDHTDRLLAAGARAYLTKPLQLARLLQLFDAWLSTPDAAGAAASPGTTLPECAASPSRARGES